jgi:hypothetical protein
MYIKGQKNNRKDIENFVKFRIITDGKIEIVKKKFILIKSAFRPTTSNRKTRKIITKKEFKQIKNTFSSLKRY